MVAQHVWGLKPVVGLIKEIATKVCPMAVQNGTIICPGMVRQMVGPAIEGIRGSFLEPSYFCEYYLPVCTKQTFTRHLAQDYVADLMASKPVALQSNSYLNDLYESISGDSSRETITAIHFTDPHIDA